MLLESLQTLLKVLQTYFLIKHRSFSPRLIYLYTLSHLKIKRGGSLRPDLSESISLKLPSLKAEATRILLFFSLMPVSSPSFRLWNVNPSGGGWDDEYDARWKWFSGESRSDDTERQSGGGWALSWGWGRLEARPGPSPASAAHSAPQLGRDGLNLSTGDQDWGQAPTPGTINQEKTVCTDNVNCFSSKAGTITLKEV